MVKGNVHRRLSACRGPGGISARCIRNSLPPSPNRRAALFSTSNIFDSETTPMPYTKPAQNMSCTAHVHRDPRFSHKCAVASPSGDLSPPASSPSRQPSCFGTPSPLFDSTLLRHPPLSSLSPSSSTVPVSHMHKTSPPSPSSQTRLTYIHSPAPQRALTLLRAPCNARRPSSSLSRARPIRFPTLLPPI